MKKLYSAGYLIRIDSWENDADHCKTKEVNVKTEEDTRAIVAFCNLFRSENDRRYPGGIGNIYEPRESDDEKLQKIFQDFVELHPNLLKLEDYDIEAAKEDPTLIAEWCIEYAYDLGLSGGEFYTRVLDRITVLYFPEDVLCEDVTGNFK